jgi:hypothetical protein
MLNLLFEYRVKVEELPGCGAPILALYFRPMTVLPMSPQESECGGLALCLASAPLFKFGALT